MRTKIRIPYDSRMCYRFQLVGGAICEISAMMAETDMTHDESPAIPFEVAAPKLARFLGLEEAKVRDYYRELEADRGFLDAINEKIAGVPEFGGKAFKHVRELRVFRAMLYAVVRATRPTTMVETGVLNGFGSAFTLLAMSHNDHGTLLAIDIPPDNPRMAGQGTTPLPIGKSPGWLIPDSLSVHPRRNFCRSCSRNSRPERALTCSSTTRTTVTHT